MAYSYINGKHSVNFLKPRLGIWVGNIIFPMIISKITHD